MEPNSKLTSDEDIKESLALETLPVYIVYYIIGGKSSSFASFSVKMSWRFIKRYFKEINLPHLEYKKQKKIFYSDPEHYESIEPPVHISVSSIYDEVPKSEVLNGLDRKDSKKTCLYKYTIEVESYEISPQVKLYFTVQSRIIIVGKESIPERIKKTLIENHSFSKERAERIVSKNKKQLLYVDGYEFDDLFDHIKISNKILFCTDLSMY